MYKTEIWAHRGASGYAPENTLEAFALAKRQGADGIELDVQMTKDGELVVIHDETIDRVTDGTGGVRQYTLAQLKSFSVNCGDEKCEGIQIPTLQETLELVKAGQMKVNIELKTGIVWYPELEKKVAALVKNQGMEERVVYSSFNHYSIQEIKKYAPEAETAYLYSDIILNVDQYAKSTNIQGLHPALYHVKMADFLEQYKRSGLAIRVWTVNEEADMRMLIEHGVDGIITNYPDLAIKIREEME